MTEPLDPKNDWVAKNTVGHTEADWRLKHTDANLVADNIIWVKGNLGGGGGATNLTTTRTGTQVTVASDTGTDAVLPAADGANAGVMTTTMQTKLAGVQTGATLNATDAALRDRATHTGTQLATTISNLQEVVEDYIGTRIVEGANVSVTYNDTTGLTTIAADAAGGGTTTVVSENTGLDLGFAVGYEMAQYSSAVLSPLYYQAKQCFAHRMRVIVSPHAIGAGPSYDWSSVDRQVDGCEAAGLNPHILLEGPRNTGGTAMVPPTAAIMTPIAAATAARYAGRVQTWEVLNEINHVTFWGGIVQNVPLYKSILQGCYDAIHAVNPDAIVVSGGSAHCNTVNNTGAWDPLPRGIITTSPEDFLTQLYAAGGGPYFDAVGFHPFTVEVGIEPTAPVPTTASNAFTRDVMLRATMVANGDAAKQVWWSEFGYPTTSDSSALGFQITPAQQADYIAEVLRIASQRAWVGPVLVYDIKDIGTDGTNPEHNYGAFTNAGAAKPLVSRLATMMKPMPAGVPTAAADPTKVDKTSTASVVYGTTSGGAQTTYPLASLGSGSPPPSGSGGSTFGDLMRPALGMYPSSDVTSLVADSTNPSYSGQKGYNFATDASKFRFGGVLTDVSGYGYNTINGAATGVGITPMEMEFYHSGDRLAWQLYSYGANDFRVLADDQPVGVTWGVLPTGEGVRYVKLQFATSKVRKIRFLLPSTGFMQLLTPSTGYIWPAEPRYKVAVLSDSWFQGGTAAVGPISAGSAAGQWAIQTGWEIWSLGQSGTGYSNPGNGTTTPPGSPTFTDRFGSSSRLAALAALPAMDLVVVFGGANDAAFSVYPQATTVSNATAVWNAVAAARPSTPLIVGGVESGVYPGSTDIDPLNEALRDSAESNGNVLVYIDQRQTPAWVSGTGNESAKNNTGNADIFVGSDAAHPNHAGWEYQTRRFLNELRVVPLGTAGGGYDGGSP